MIFQKNERRPRREHDFEVQVGPRWRPRRPKIAPRRVQDRLGSVFLTLEFSLRFCIVFGSVLVPIWPPKWCPRGGTKLGLGPLGPIQDGLEIVLVRFSCRLVVRDRFFGRLGLLLGSFLGAPWVVLVLFRHFNSSIQPINSSTRRFNPSTHQPIDSTHQPINSSIQPINLSILYRRSMTFPRVMASLCSLLFRFVLVFVVLCSLTCLLIYSSTHQPMALRHFLTRPGGLRAARLNNNHY